LEDSEFNENEIDTASNLKGVSTVQTLETEKKPYLHRKYPATSTAKNHPSETFKTSGTTTINVSKLDVSPLPQLSENDLQHHLDEITKKLESTSIVDSEWEGRLNSIKLLHAIAITPQNKTSNSTFCTHPIFVHALSSMSLRNSIKKQFEDARSTLVKAMCDCLNAIACYSGVCTKIHFFSLFLYYFICLLSLLFLLFL
jgi:hypothetical protein